MTAASRRLSLVPSLAEVIPLPRPPVVEYDQILHHVLGMAAEGRITRTGTHITNGGKPVGQAVRARLGTLHVAGLIEWHAWDEHGEVGVATVVGAQVLTDWDGPAGGDAA